MTIVVGVDIGSTNTKVVLIDAVDSGRAVWTGRAATPADPSSLKAVISRLLRAATATTRRPVAAIGISSMAETGVPVDGHGVALSAFLRWDRVQNRDVLGRVLERHPDLPLRSGIPATPKPALMTLLGLREHAPEIHARLAQWRGVADVVVEALTGRDATDHTLAARTMMLDATVQHEHRWDTALLDEAGISEQVLPRIVHAGEPAGMTGHAAAGFGLGRDIPVYIAGHDHAVGAWAAGARGVGDMADSLGTAEALLAVTDRPDPRAVADGLSIGRTVDDCHFTVMAGNPACGGLLAEWPDDVLGHLSRLSAEAWDTTPAVILPYPRGRQCPAPDPTARLRVLGEDEADAPRALLQSLVLHSAWMRRTVERVTGARADRVVLLGSLTDRIPVWASLTAAMGTTPVRRCTSSEPVAAGAALLAAVRAGLAPEPAVLETEPVVPCRAEGLDAAYDRFVAHALSDPTHPLEGDS
ncbi:L-fuculokinase [Microbacterium sp. P01]|uniref:FGGY-family carbohydrate kinase n=1 Tax=Microbacterium sp. P01 TaxID=3366261 RepID=UPI00366D7CA6